MGILINITISSKIQCQDLVVNINLTLRVFSCVNDHYNNAEERKLSVCGGCS